MWYILNTAELHPWLHSRHKRETDINFGDLTVIWDHIIGTYYRPKRRPRRDVGVDFSVSADFNEQVIQPLTRTSHRPVGAVNPALPAGDAGNS